MQKVKRKLFLIIFILIIIFIYLFFSRFSDVPVKNISLTAGDFEHIQFSTKSPNIYQYSDNELRIEVDNSASFLMRAFDKVKVIEKIDFEWKSDGSPQIRDAAHESQRDGDDAVFKLGLLIESDDELDTVFLPAWMRRVNALLHFPSAEMIFLVAGAKHQQRQRWSGPYNHRMTMISMSSFPDEAASGWNKVSYHFEQPVKVVALWLMADGDDTHSKFTSKIKNIVIGESGVSTPSKK